MESGRKSVIRNFVQQVFVVEDSLDLLRVYAIFRYLGAVCQKRKVSAYDAIRDTERLNRIETTFGLFVRRDFLKSLMGGIVLNAISEQIQGMTIEEYVDAFLPGLITEKEKVLELLEEVDSNFMEKALLILMAKNIWRRKCGITVPIDGYEARARLKIDKVTLDKIILAVNCYSFSFRSSVHKAAREAHLALEKFGFSEEHQIAIYGQVREKLVKEWSGRKTKWREGLENDYADSIRAALGKNSQLDIFRLDAAVNDTAESLGKIERPTHFLSAVLVSAENDDSKIENNFVRAKFLGAVQEDDTSLLVVNPSPSFLGIYPEKLLERTTFVVKSAAAAHVLQHEFPESRFFTIAELLREEDSEILCTKALLFAREIEKEERRHVICAIKKCLIVGGTLLALLPQSDIIGESRDNKYFESSFSLENLELLPVKTSNSQPKKKVFVVAKKEKEQHDIAVTNYVWLEEKEFLCAEKEQPVTISVSMLDTSKSIGQVYRDAYEEMTKEKSRNPANAFRYSPEITFWYTTSRYAYDEKKRKIEVYVCEFPTKQRKKRGKEEKGKKDESVYASKVLSSEQWEIENWLHNELPYDERMLNGVKRIFSKNDSLLRSGQVSLKTLWFLGLQNGEPPEEELRLLSSAVGNLSLSDSAESYKEAMDEYCKEKSLSAECKLWLFLNSLIQTAVTKGYLQKNHIQKIAEDYREKRDMAIYAIRAAIAKRTFHSKEEWKILNAASCEIGAGKHECLCVPIRLFTGLEPAVISALSWGNIHRIPGTSIRQFIVYQKIGVDNLPVYLEDRVDYRRIPIHPQLDALLREREDQIKRMGFKESEIKKLQIIASDDQLSGRINTIITPKKIKELSKDIIRSIGIREVVFDVPDRYRGMVEMVLSSYNGDMFRWNFRYRGNQACKFTDAESRYLLGNHQKTPFGKNYVDFTNDFAQIKMYKKLRRWIVGEPCKQFLPLVKEIPGAIRVSEENKRSGVSLHIQRTTTGENVKVSVHCEHGCTVSAYFAKETRRDTNHA